MKQKEIFLAGEGDAWFERNTRGPGARKFPDEDPLLMELLGILRSATTPAVRVLEIGCGEGARLAWLKEHRGCDCQGVDPSARAVESARRRGVNAQCATAERLPFTDHAFDVVMFGFCLYLCDREDLFRIACEADRVLRNPGWLLIFDFYSPFPTKHHYRHREGVFSHKMDYSALFNWHPGYTTYSHKVSHHSDGGYTDDTSEWVAISLLRKNFERGG